MINTTDTKADLTRVPLLTAIPRFAIPIAVGSILQHLFNSVDVAIVGRFAGSAALSAVGANAAPIALFVNMLVGLAAGPNVVAAQLIGQKQYGKVRETVHTAIWLSVMIGILLCAVGLGFSEPLLRMMGTPESILKEALVYLRVYCAALPFIAVCNFGSALLRSSGDTKRPLYTLLTAGLINVILNLVFVIGFHLDVFGVALATVLANVFSAAVIVVLLMHETGCLRYTPKDTRPTRTLALRMISVGLPSGLQGMIFSFSNLFVQSAINSFGAAAIAGSSTALNFEYFTYDIACAFGQACVTFTGQNYGAGDAKRCRQVFVTAFLYGLICTEAAALFFARQAAFFSGLYTTDPEIIHFAVQRMLCVGAFEGLSAFHETAGASARAIGHPVLPTVITVMGSVVFRILWILTVFAAHPTFITLMVAYPISWILTGVSMLICLAYIASKLSLPQTARK